jgi:hypothetical protein
MSRGPRPFLRARDPSQQGIHGRWPSRQPFLQRISRLRSPDESAHSSCHPKLMLATSGESIQPAASCHETPIFKLPQRGEDRTLTHLPGKSGRVRMTHHQSKQSRLEHASP